VNCILGGQALASVANGYLSWSVGIVVVATISILVSFFGLTVLNWYEQISWLPVLITFVIASAVGGKHLFNPPPAVPATVSAVLSFASTLAGFSISYCRMSSDYTSYFHPDVSRCESFTRRYSSLSRRGLYRRLPIWKRISAFLQKMVLSTIPRSIMRLYQHQ